MRILYVEDNPANVFLVKRVAKMGQHEIINFIDGREAIRKFEEINPDLVLMDIQLVGETSGLQVVKELRANGVTTPIIAVTAYAMVGDKERCMEAGCNDYLAKPLPIPRLVEIFETYSQQISASAPTPTPTVEEKSEPPVPALPVETVKSTVEEKSEPPVPALPVETVKSTVEEKSEPPVSTPAIETVKPAVEEKSETPTSTPAIEAEQPSVEKAETAQDTTSADATLPVAEKADGSTSTDNEKPSADIKSDSEPTEVRRPAEKPASESNQPEVNQT